MLKMTPVQIKPKLFPESSLILGRASFAPNLHFGDFFYWITEEKKHFQNQRNIYVLHCSTK